MSHLFEVHPGEWWAKDSFHEEYPKPRPKICDSVLQVTGNTPLVRLERLCREDGVEAEVLAKCEFFNAGGSVKDRIGLRMIEDAERTGRIKPGDTLIEPTSGNTGIGLALAAAVKGYKMIITLPEKMSKEKVDVLRALGAEIHRTPTEAAWDAPESHIGVAKKLNAEIPNSHILNQYSNAGNPCAHYDQTAEEILEACEGRIDALVLSAGTGGHLTGIARKIKERVPGVKVFGVDNVGSLLAQPESMNDHKRLQPYQVEGTGYDFIPEVLDRSLVDEWIKTEDEPAFRMARRMIRSEGLLCGGSCGMAVHAAMQVAKNYGKGQRIVTLCPDSLRNYMTKFLSDTWMEEHGFMEPASTPQQEWWSSHSVSQLNVAPPCTVLPTVSVGETVRLLREQGFDQLPVVSETNDVLGTVTEGNLSAQLLAGRVVSEDLVSKVMYKNYRSVSLTATLAQLAHLFDSTPYVLVLNTQKSFGEGGKMVEKKIVCGVITRIDLLDYVNEGPKISQLAL